MVEGCRVTVALGAIVGGIAVGTTVGAVVGWAAGLGAGALLPPQADRVRQMRTAALITRRCSMASPFVTYNGVC